MISGFCSGTSLTETPSLFWEYLFQFSDSETNHDVCSSSSSFGDRQIRFSWPVKQVFDRMGFHLIVLNVRVLCFCGSSILPGFSLCPETLKSRKKEMNLAMGNQKKCYNSCTQNYISQCGDSIFFFFPQFKSLRLRYNSLQVGLWFIFRYSQTKEGVNQSDLNTCSCFVAQWDQITSDGGDWRNCRNAWCGHNFCRRNPTLQLLEGRLLMLLCSCHENEPATRNPSSARKTRPWRQWAAAEVQMGSSCEMSRWRSRFRLANGSSGWRRRRGTGRCAEVSASSRHAECTESNPPLWFFFFFLLLLKITLMKLWFGYPQTGRRMRLLVFLLQLAAAEGAYIYTLQDCWLINRSKIIQFEY